MNNCVGAKNYKYFIGYTITTGVSCAFHLLCSIVMFMKVLVTWSPLWLTGTCIPTLILLPIISVVNVIVGSWVVTLLRLHYKLTKDDFTTYEYLVYMRDRKARLK